MDTLIVLTKLVSQYGTYFAAPSQKIDLKNSANILFRNYRDFLFEIAMCMPKIAICIGKIAHVATQELVFQTYVVLACHMEVLRRTNFSQLIDLMLFD